jgi:hypothetical protein
MADWLDADFLAFMGKAWWWTKRVVKYAVTFCIVTLSATNALFEYFIGVPLLRKMWGEEWVEKNLYN